MAIFNKFFQSVFFAVLCASYGQGAAWPTSSKYSTHRVRSVGRGLSVESFHPPSEYKTFEAGLELPQSFSTSNTEDKTTSFITSQLNVNSSQVVFTSGYNTDDSEFGYLKQSHEGVSFVNAVANVAIKNNKVVAFGQSFVDTSRIASSTPTVDVSTVIPKVEEVLQGKKNEIEPTVEYLALDDGSVALVHVFQVRNDEAFTFYEVYADAHSGELLSVTDFVSHASYKVIPVYKQNITEGLELITDPAITTASPQGWHSDGNTATTVTAGNNVIAFKGSQTNTTSQSSDGLVFNYTYDPSVSATTGNNVDAARANAFYIANSYHDTLYLYGFTEASFNFQNVNFNKGGKGSDRVLMSVQDSLGTNNAAFVTFPEGQSGLAYMFIFDVTSPTRDGVMQNDIVIHELTHGLTNRMTGGGTAGCLQTDEAGGMGEGWSDTLANWFQHTGFPEVTDFVTGSWVLGNPNGGRSHPYSTSQTVNPFTYATIAALDEVHDIGEVWANMLHNVYAALVNAHGWSATARTDASGSEGNVVFLRLLVDALTLQPCNPTLLSARDAWIQADVNRYDGANKCILWNTFASRGLGVNAKNFVDDSTVADGC